MFCLLSSGDLCKNKRKTSAEKTNQKDDKPKDPKGGEDNLLTCCSLLCDDYKTEQDL